MAAALTTATATRVAPTAIEAVLNRGEATRARNRPGTRGWRITGWTAWHTTPSSPYTTTSTSPSSTVSEALTITVTTMTARASAEEAWSAAALGRWSTKTWWRRLPGVSRSRTTNPAASTSAPTPK